MTWIVAYVVFMVLWTARYWRRSDRRLADMRQRALFKAGTKIVDTTIADGCS